MQQITAILVGAGDRGQTYASYMKAMPDKYKLVGIAEPIAERRERLRQEHGIPVEHCFASWEELLALPKLADVAIIATVDNMHYEPALRAIDRGYHLLLEKPVAQTAQECVDVMQAAQRKGVEVLVCHVLRYSPFFNTIKKLVMNGEVGRVMSIEHAEALGNLHYSHSYVRGNWHCEAESTPMLLAKSCHDLDILQWLLDEPCKRVQSFGSLTYFTAANAPEGAPVRCADGGCPVGDTCPYNCMHFYYDRKDNGWREVVAKGIAKSGKATDEEILEALRTTDYGLCVFHANNDVVDHQVVNMEFESGATVTFSMNGFNRGERSMHIFGTKGEIWANMHDSTVRLFRFSDREIVDVPLEQLEESIFGGHGGGDGGLIEEMYEYFSGSYHGYRAANIDVSVKNHLIGFAAERARHSGTVQSVDDFMSEFDVKNEY